MQPAIAPSGSRLLEGVSSAVHERVVGQEAEARGVGTDETFRRVRAAVPAP